MSDDAAGPSTYTIYELSLGEPILKGTKHALGSGATPGVQVLIRKGLPNADAITLLERVITELMNNEAI